MLIGGIVQSIKITQKRVTFWTIYTCLSKSNNASNDQLHSLAFKWLQVSVVTRDEVGAYKPYLWEQSVFDKGPMFREWLLTKIVNGERASYSAPKFARMQERTRSQMLEDIVANLANHAETGQIPKPYRYMLGSTPLFLHFSYLILWLGPCVFPPKSPFLCNVLFTTLINK